MLYKYGKLMCNFFGRYFNLFCFSLPYSGYVFNKTIIPLTFIAYEMIIANSALHYLLVIYHLISIVFSQTHCKITVSVLSFFLMFDFLFARLC